MGRYDRQEALVDQGLLLRSRVLVAGVGGLGSFVATELALAGVGDMHLVDPDVVELHNLNRQFLYRESDVGKPKAVVAAERLLEINPHIRVKSRVGSWQDLDVNSYDLVVDCLDSWQEKRALMRTRKGILVSGSVGEDIGYVAVLKTRRIEASVVRKTDVRSILGARVGVVGSIMANEVLRELSGQPSPLRDRLLHIDFGQMRFTVFDL